MSSTVHRRGFLKTVTAAAGTLAYGFVEGAPSPAEETSSAKTTAAEAPAISSVAYRPLTEYPIRPKPFSEVTLTDSFWQPKMKRNAEVTIPFEIQKFHERERPIANNVLQAAIFSLQTYPDAKLQAQVDAGISSLLAAHESRRGAHNENFEVAATLFTATGRRDLLDPSIVSADGLYKTYQTDNPPFNGGERDAINCIALYSVTLDTRYLDLAKHYLDIRGASNAVDPSRHNQSYKPVVEQSEAVGHAVNDASLMVSLIDVGTLTGLDVYSRAAARIWNDAVTTKLYITGGIGSTGNEGFGRAYELPNLSAYAETCAGLMFTTFNHKMFLATGDARYVDVMERAMYNNVLDGVSADGGSFFYVNRLASASDGRNVRWQRASLECCPPNLVRFMASMPQYLYAQRGNVVFVNLYVSSHATFKLSGKDVTLHVDSEMPWGGRTKIAIQVKEPTLGSIKFRIPGWLRNQPTPGDLYAYLDKPSGQPAIAINGKPVLSLADDQGYVTVERTWHPGDIITVDFPLEVRKVVAHPRVRENKGRMAIERGPIVYCAEWPDYAGGNVLTTLFDPKSELKPVAAAVSKTGLFANAVLIEGQARKISKPQSEPVAVRLIPYHLWANRGVGEMAVWLSADELAIGDIGPAGGLIFHVNKNYATDGWRYLEATPFDQSSGAKRGSFRVPIAGAKDNAIGTGKQNTRDIKSACDTPGIAADLCQSLSFNGFQDWFLPSFDELKEMYLKLKVAGLGGFPSDVPDNCDYWSSTQVTTDMARHLDFADNGVRGHYDDKDYPRRVRAIRSF